MSKRLSLFKKFADCPIRKSIIRKLGGKGVEFVETYILKYDHLDKHQFAKQINMLFIDDASKPKNHADIWAILMECNS